MCRRDPEEGGAANVSAIVWTERTPIAQVHVRKLDDMRVARGTARRLGEGGGARGRSDAAGAIPLSAMHAHRYTDTRLALVGDAAHAIHPIAGQGGLPASAT